MREGRFHATMAMVCLAVAAVSVYGTYATGITVSLSQLVSRLALLAALLAGAAFYRWRREEKLLNLLMMTFWAVLITNLHMFPMFVAARQRVELCDDRFAQFDAALGIQVPDVLAVMRQYPALASFLEASYGLLTLLITLAVMVPPLCGRMDRAKEFALGVTVSALISMPTFAALPAVGPWVHYQYSPSPEQDRCMKTLLELKSAEPFAMDLAYADGLICFPSFHAILAVLAAMALRSTPYLRWPAALLACLIVVSTVTTGWHYLIDVLGGLVVVAASLSVAHVYLWLESGNVRMPGPRPLAVGLSPPHRRVESVEASIAT
jgi:hypothetical protein